MDKITTINGILMTAQNDFTEHVENTTVHVTEQEKEKWNKAPDYGCSRQYVPFPAI